MNKSFIRCLASIAAASAQYEIKLPLFSACVDDLSVLAKLLDMYTSNFILLYVICQAEAYLMCAATGYLSNYKYKIDILQSSQMLKH